MRRRQWDVVSRLLAGGLGGYVLAHALPVALVAPWELARADAVLIAMMFSFVVHAAAIMFAFAARSAGRAWAGISTLALAAATAAWCWL